MLVLIDRFNDEIHVSVPFALKGRVKKIPGYSWDPAQKVWTFAYSDALYASLKAEFGAEAMYSGFEPDASSIDWGASSSESVLRRDIKLLRDNLLEARDRIDALERELAAANARVKRMLDSETVLTESELELLRAHRKLVLEQARKDRPISW